MSRADDIRRAFLVQADWCDRLGSPFTALLCTALATALDAATPIGQRVLGWPGDPTADALALRLCGGLHALVRGGRAPKLSVLYPPASLPPEQVLARELQSVLDAHAASLHPWLDRPPQTNEVGRSAVLMSGLLAVSDRFRLPLRLFELGASAGLNLQLDRYAIRLGGIAAGCEHSPLRLDPEWRGAPPPEARPEISGRFGVDLDPIDAVSARERLLAYVWPDQGERLNRLGAALDLAAADPPPVAQGDAADWIETHLTAAPGTGVCRVVLHSVAFEYFPAATQARVRARLQEAGARANEAAPLAWLRYEKMAEDREFSLRLRCWPGEDRLLAWAHAHGAWIDWVAGRPATGSGPVRL
ncbi:DUF2332 domain-containing protein [Sphingosinicella sp. CPCC 101087]|uniref:DUF2332 domain-containing protein n=1 Tax=Sphingosinicella sp. CPCC 101087 TaxID=2497754 RepID=UPI00198178CE|nr:DUF2332 family protein [Sphingosinicella sp. CPCC 101087]